MAQDVIIRGVTYQGVAQLDLAKNGGTALYRDTSDADAAAGDIAIGKTAYGASGLIIGTKTPPSGSISITDNGVVDVTDYASAVVNVQGGGGGPTASDAILLVTAPAGSTVTATKGGTTLVPTLWISAADPTLETALFVVESSLFDSQNAWTVTATDGTGTASQTVAVDAAKQYDVKLDYTLWLYDRGNLYGYPWKINVHNASYSNPTGTTLTASGRQSQARGCYGFFINQLIDLTDASTITVHCTEFSDGSSLELFLSPAVQSTGQIYYYMVTKPSDKVLYTELTALPADGLVSLDVSSLTGSYYINFGGRARAVNTTCTVTADEVYYN